MKHILKKANRVSRMLALVPEDKNRLVLFSEDKIRLQNENNQDVTARGVRCLRWNHAILRNMLLALVPEDQTSA